jgi:hypothetical protein
VKTLGLILSLKAKAQHSPLISNLHRQGYTEVKLHMILVGEMGTLQRPYRQTFGIPQSGCLISCPCTIQIGIPVELPVM